MQRYRSWVEIDTDAVAHNVEYFRSQMKPDVTFLGMVKSNAYGHGLVRFAKELVENGVDWLGVDAIEEAFALRSAGIKTPILVVGYTLPQYFQQAAALNITLTISTKESLAALAEMNLTQPLSIHLELETGLGRQGFLWKDRKKMISMLQGNTSIHLHGIFSHLAAAESPEYREHTNKQKEKLEAWKQFFADAGFEPMVHIAASAAAMLYEDFHFDMIRAGISLYGLWPSEKVIALYDGGDDDIKPTLTWKSIISEYKPLPEGSRVGYDLTEQLHRDSVIAIVPVGYWHGYPRHLSSVGEVLVGGKRAKVLGRVSMDMIIIDVTSIENVAVGDEVVLLGSQGDDRISAMELGEKAGTINYEIVTRINQDIPRYYN